MNNLRLSDPLFNDPFESVMRRFLTPSGFEAELPMLRMAVDVAERNGIYEVKADLPGVKKDDISVRIDGNVVQIDAQVNREKETKSKTDKILRSERYQGTISRTFSMAEDIDDAKVSAKFNDGVLTLELPKKATAATKKITVQ
ncbi:MAG: Hsp20/alpha crystallin family protein [Burkholderiales bacterium]